MPYKRNFVLKILKSLAANYPVLRELGYVISQPIVLMEQEKNFSLLLDCMENISLPRLEDCINDENLRESANADFCWTSYRSRGSEKKLENAAEFASRAYADLENTAPPVLILADGRILRDKELDYIFVFVENLQAEEIALEEIVPEDDELAWVFEKISEIVPECRTQTEQAFVASSCFLFPDYLRNGLQKDFPQMIVQAKALAEQSEAGIEGIAELFVDEAYRWQTQVDELTVFLLPNLGFDGIKNISGCIYVEASNFYLSDQLFREIADPLLRVFAEEQIKAALAKQGILRPESDRTFTAKMNFRSVAGTYERCRMLRFSREKFVKDGEVEFVDLCLLKRKGI